MSVGGRCPGNCLKPHRERGCAEQAPGICKAVLKLKLKEVSLRRKLGGREGVVTVIQELKAFTAALENTHRLTNDPALSPAICKSCS